jgi:predicted RNase H-like HicB family nuclease
MHNEFTAIIKKDGDWYIAYCPEVPGANGQGKTIEESKESLAAAISLILDWKIDVRTPCADCQKMQFVTSSRFYEETNPLTAFAPVWLLPQVKREGGSHSLYG